MQTAADSVSSVGNTYIASEACGSIVCTSAADTVAGNLCSVGDGMGFPIANFKYHDYFNNSYKILPFCLYES